MGRLKMAIIISYILFHYMPFPKEFLKNTGHSPARRGIFSALSQLTCKEARVKNWSGRASLGRVTRPSFTCSRGWLGGRRNDMTGQVGLGFLAFLWLRLRNRMRQVGGWPLIV